MIDYRLSSVNLLFCAARSTRCASMHAGRAVARRVDAAGRLSQLGRLRPRPDATPARAADLDHQPISVRIRNALLERILGGHYAPGDRLVELQLAREFGTSQAPVREALRDLETAGLVTIRPRRGSFVNDYHATDPARDLRMCAARWRRRRCGSPCRASRATARQLRVASRRHARGGARRRRRGDDPPQRLVPPRRSCRRPGTSCCSACGNRCTSRSIRARRCCSRTSTCSAVAESHAPIFDAIEAGDAELACRLSREHQAYFERRA